MTAFVFPLRPGRPFVHRQRNGRWGWTCNCLHRTNGRHIRTHSARYNCHSWQHALQSAMDHVRYAHKTREQLLTETLEAWYAQPPAIPDRARHVRRCAHCREPITGLWVGPMPEPGTYAAPRFHFDREPCAAASGAYGPGERL